MPSDPTHTSSRFDMSREEDCEVPMRAAVAKTNGASRKFENIVTNVEVRGLIIIYF